MRCESQRHRPKSKWLALTLRGTASSNHEISTVLSHSSYFWTHLVAIYYYDIYSDSELGLFVCTAVENVSREIFRTNGTQNAQDCKTSHLQNVIAKRIAKRRKLATASG